MGLFDYVHVSGPGWTCPEGHDLTDHEWQTKDLGSTMGQWDFGEIGTEIQEVAEGCCNETEIEPVVEIYTSCTRCPCMVQMKSGNVLDLWVEYRVTLDGRRIVSRTRTSDPLPTQIEYWCTIGGVGEPMIREAAEVERQRIWSERNA